METITRHAPHFRSAAARKRAEIQGRRILAEEGTINIFQAALLQLVTEDVLTRHGYRLLFWLMSEMDMGNAIHYSTAECARRIGMPYHTCWRAWKSLRLHGLLRGVYSATGRLECYQVSPRLCWRGRPWKAAKVVQHQAGSDGLAALAAQLEDDE